MSDIHNFNAPLHATLGDPSDGNVEAVVAAYLQTGIPAGKLVIGIPFYGRGWQGVPAEDNGFYQPAARPSSPPSFDYTELKRNYISTDAPLQPQSSYQRFWHNEAKVPWLYSPETGIMITYNPITK